MPSRQIDRAVQIQDPRGLVITLAPNDWYHIVEGHPEMESRLEQVTEALGTPTVIQQSTTDPQSQFYYWLKPIDFKRFSSLYVAVVVKVDKDSATGRVRTAYLTGKLGRGDVLWAQKP